MIHDDPWRKLLRPLSVIVYHANIQQTKEPPERGLKKGCWDKTQPARYFLATHPTQALYCPCWSSFIQNTDEFIMQGILFS